MRNLLVLLALLALLCSCTRKPAEPGSLSASSFPPYVKWEGRYEEKAEETALLFTASGFTVSFSGTRLEAVFNHEGSDIYYNVGLDGESLPNPGRVFCLKAGEKTSSIVIEGLEEGMHTATMLKMSEPADGYVALAGLSTDGRFIERDRENDAGRLRFMFVCASGGSGYGSLAYTENPSVTPKRTTANSSSLHAFCYLTARLFKADVQFVAQSGWTVSIPDKAIADVMEQSGITASSDVQGALSTAPWDLQSWVPDLIIFNIGGNDTVSSLFDRPAYQGKVVEMVEKLHQAYPDAYMVWTHTNSNAGTYAITALSDAGFLRQGWLKEVVIPKVGYLKPSGEADNPWVSEGAGNHNSLATHIATADILANALETWGFARACENITLSSQRELLQSWQ